MIKSETEKAIEKIKKSREYRLDPENQSYIATLEGKLEELKTDASFQKLDQVKIIRNTIKSIIVDCKKRLIEEDKPEERARLKADRDAYTRILKFFSRNIDREMLEITQKVNEMLD